MVSCARVVALLMLVISFIFLLAGTTTRAWKEEENKQMLGDTLWYGLFKICREDYYEEKCDKNYEDVPGWLHATRAMMILATTLCGIALFVGALQVMFMSDPSKVKLWIAGVLMLFAGIFGCIGVIIYTARGKPPIWENPQVQRQYNFSFSFAFGWVGSIVSILTFIMCFIGQAMG